MTDSKVAKALLRVLAIPAALFISAAAVIGSSQASFNGTSTNEGSSWKAGSISLGDTAKDSIEGNVLFPNKVISPGYKESRCVTVISNSDIKTRVKMYGMDVSSTPVSEAMQISVEKGSISPEGFKGYSCETFYDGATILNTSLADFGTSVHDYSDGISNQNGGDQLLPGGTATYRITLELPSDVDNSVSESKAGATFKWEAQS